MPKKILIVDDDRHIRETVEFSFSDAGFECIEAADGKAAISMFHSSSPDLIILDIGMPEMDGIEVCREIRKESEIPIIFLSARDSELDRILGLEMGGDDYVTKPFSPRELVARAKNIIRRTTKEPLHSDAIKSYTYKDLVVDLERRKVYYGETELILSATEFDILAALAKRPQIVFTRDMLIDTAYEENFALSERTIDSHIRRIRAKFEKVGAGELIQTVRGCGYKLE